LESFVDISQLKAAQVELKAAHDHLERRVEERTSALKKSQAQLIQAEKLGALGTLTAGIAHELNNPMMGMLNFAQYCQKHVPDGSKVHGILGDMERETRRCIEIVRNLQTFSRMETMDHEAFEAISCEELIERVHKLLSYRFDKEDVSFDIAVAEDCPKAFINASNMQQVFLNLISNALDAVKEGEKRAIQVRAEADGESGVRVQVTDTGPGISEKSQERIFDPFYTTKPVGKGTGLGLSVSQSIVESYNGKIECKSTKGKGTTFTVWLPVRQDPK
jgi:two-component system NtrC family sensor kinase